MGRQLCLRRYEHALITLEILKLEHVAFLQNYADTILTLSSQWSLWRWILISLLNTAQNNFTAMAHSPAAVYI